MNTRAPFERLVTGLKVQGRVIHALMLREMLTSFGREHLGIFWLMGEPLVLTIGVMILWSLASHEEQASVGVIPFALTGYTIITLWRHLSMRLMKCVSQNLSLMFHRNVHYFDVLLSRAFLEIAGTGLSFITIYISLYVTGFIEPLYDPYLLAGGWLLTGWFSFAVGLIIAGGTQIYPILERFVAPVMYITLPLTGLFTMISWLPDKLANILRYSPLANCFELFRDGLFGHNVDAQWDGIYIIKANIIATAIGFLLIRKAQNSIRFE